MRKQLEGLICPICRQKMRVENKSLLCNNKHCFDISKQGYCNILPVNKKHSIVPGDNKLMIDARYDFLQKGHYELLSNRINFLIDKHISAKSRVLDAGCGYGYYCNNLYHHRNGMDIIDGVDISKFALAKGGKLNENINYFVASVFDLPYVSKNFDIILSVFSPFAMEEYHRVCKDNGYLIVVSPAERHLMQLKELIYDNKAIENNKSFDFGKWSLVEKVRLNYDITINSNAELLNLFYMTPYCYTSSVEQLKRLTDTNNLLTEVDFYITVLKK